MPPELLARMVDELPWVDYIKEEGEPCTHLMSRTGQLVKNRAKLKGIFGGQAGRYFMNETARGACGTMPACDIPDAHRALRDAFERRDAADHRELDALHKGAFLSMNPATCAIEIACWDILGKSLGAPPNSALAGGGPTGELISVRTRQRPRRRPQPCPPSRRPHPAAAGCGWAQVPGVLRRRGRRPSRYPAPSTRGILQDVADSRSEWRAREAIPVLRRGLGARRDLLPRTALVKELPDLIGTKARRSPPSSSPAGPTRP